MENISSDIMTIQEASEFLRIPLSSLYKLAQQGKIPCQKIGRHWRFHKQALEKWFEKFPTIEENRENQDGLEGFLSHNE